MMHEMWDLHSHLKPQIQEYVGDWFLEGLCTSVQGSARLGRVVLGVEATLILWKRGETGFWLIFGKSVNWSPWMWVAERLQQHQLSALAKQGTCLN